MRDIGLLVLRVGLSIAMIKEHGLGKVQKIFGGDFTFMDPIGIGEAPSLVLATFGEFLFPLLVILGFKTRLASIPVAITMLVAYFAHPNELAIVYLIGFASIALTGAGKYSLDKN